MKQLKYKNLPDKLKGYELLYDVIVDNKHSSHKEFFASLQDRNNRWKELAKYEIETKQDKDNYTDKQVNLLLEYLSNKPRTLSKHKMNGYTYYDKDLNSLTINQDMIVENLPKTLNKTNKVKIDKEKDIKTPNKEQDNKDKEVSNVEPTIDKDNNQEETDKKIQQDNAVYERLFMVENQLMEYLKDNYEIPVQYQNEETLLSLIHNNFTASKVGQLDLENWNQLQAFNDLQLYNYTNIDKAGNLVNTTLNGNKVEVKEPIVFKYHKVDESTLDHKQLINKTQQDKMKLDKISNLRRELNDIKPLIFKEIYNNDVEKKLENLKEQIKNAKQPLKFSRLNNFLKDLVKNKYLFIGAMFFWPSLIIYLGMGYLALRGIELYSSISHNQQQKKRLKNIKQDINKTINHLNGDLIKLYKIGENLHNTKVELKDKELSKAEQDKLVIKENLKVEDKQISI